MIFDRQSDWSEDYNDINVQQEHSNISKCTLGVEIEMQYDYDNLENFHDYIPNYHFPNLGIREFPVKKTPAESIANGNWIGELPKEFCNITRTDELTVSLMHPCIYLSTILGTKRKSIKSHHYVVVNPNPVIENIPGNQPTRITYVGALTTQQIAEQRVRFDLNVTLCRDILQWFLKHNHEYIEHKNIIDENLDNINDNIHINRTDNSNFRVSSKLLKLMEFGSSTYNTGTTEPAPILLNSINNENENYNDCNNSDCNNNNDENELTVNEINPDLLLDGSYEGMRNDNCRSHIIFQSQSVDYCSVASNQYSKHKDLSDIAKYFPSLLPYGRGDPNEERLVNLSHEKWAKRCLRSFPKALGVSSYFL